MMAELQSAQESLEAAEQASHEARNAYQTAVAAGDMEAARQAAEAARAADADAQRWGDRVAALEVERREKAQRQADQKLKQAQKRAEEAAEAERMAAAEVSDIAERMTVLLDRMKATSDESFRATAAMQRAAADAGKDAPVVRTPASREADPRHLLKHGQAICRAFDMQDKSATGQTTASRKAG